MPNTSTSASTVITATIKFWTNTGGFPTADAEQVLQQGLQQLVTGTHGISVQIAPATSVTVNYQVTSWSPADGGSASA